MLRVLPFVCAVALMGGCVSTQPVSLTLGEDRHYLNKRALRGHPVLALRGQRGRQVQSLHIGPDSTTWIDKKSGELRSASTEDIEAVTFRRDGLGALKGFAISAAVGATLGAIRGATDDGSFLDATPVQGAAIGSTVGVYGALFGAIHSDRQIYRVSTSNETRTLAPSCDCRSVHSTLPARDTLRTVLVRVPYRSIWMKGDDRARSHASPTPVFGNASSAAGSASANRSNAALSFRGVVSSSRASPALPRLTFGQGVSRVSLLNP